MRLILKIIALCVFFYLVNSCVLDLTSDIENSTDVIISKWKYGKTSAVSFTFDDNNLTNDSVAKLFNKYNISTSFFFISDLMSTYLKKGNYSPNFELYKNHEIGSHSANHISFIRLANNQLHYELAASKDSLEKWTKKTISCFAYPYGEFSPDIMSLTRTYYLFDRYFYFPNLTIYKDYYHVLYENERGLFTLDQLLDDYSRSYINNVLNKSYWINFLGHSVGQFSGNYGYGISIDYLNSYIHEIIINKNIWLDNFTNIALYKEIRDNSIITIEDSIVSVTLDDNMRNRYLEFGIFSLPITLEFKNKNEQNFRGQSIINTTKNDSLTFLTIDLAIDNKIILYK